MATVPVEPAAAPANAPACAHRPAATQAPLSFIHPDDMPNVYAITGRGTCLEPVIHDGSLLVCDKRVMPQPGDAVALHFTSEFAQLFGYPGAVKRLRLPVDGADVIEVDQLNPPRRYTFDPADVLAIHKVVGIAEPDDTGARWRPSQEAPRC